MVISITFVKTPHVVHVLVVLESAPAVLSAFSHLRGRKHVSENRSEGPALTRSVSDAACSYSDLLWSKSEWQDCAARMEVYL